MNLRQQIYKNILDAPETVEKPLMFCQAALALGIICTLQGAEKQCSARWNRTRAAEEAILKVCDIYWPDGMDKARLTTIHDILDGPVQAVFERHKHLLEDAVGVQS